VSHFQLDTWRFSKIGPHRQNRLAGGERAREGENVEKTGKVSGGAKVCCFLHFKKGKTVRYATSQVVEETFFDFWPVKANGDNRRCHLSFLSK
jgi:hypothetical protein